MNRFILYLKEVYRELVTKVTWPTWKELLNSATLVMIASLIFAVIVFIMDFSFMRIIAKAYSIFL